MGYIKVSRSKSEIDPNELEQYMHYEKIDYDGFKIIEPKDIKIKEVLSHTHSPSHSKGISSGPANKNSDDKSSPSRGYPIS